eukprot:4077214-Pleurochrysis_carterae.AAC.2
MLSETSTSKYILIKRIPANRRTVGQLRVATARQRLNFGTCGLVALNRHSGVQEARGFYRPLWRAPSTPDGAEGWAQPADFGTKPSARIGLKVELDLMGASRRANNA